MLVYSHGPLFAIKYDRASKCYIPYPLVVAMQNNPHESPDGSHLISKKLIKDIEGMYLTSKMYHIIYY